MDKTRTNKVERLIQKDLGIIFQQEARNMFSGKMISVTTVRISPDLSIAKTYLSIFPPENKEEILQMIALQKSKLRHLLGQKIRHQLRKIPDLQFFIDDSLDYVERIEELLNQ